MKLKNQITFAVHIPISL